MIKLNLHIICSFLSIICLLTACDKKSAAKPQDNAPIVSLMPACAPWGGEALNVNFPMNDRGRRFEGAIWGQGLIAFREGRAFVIDNVVGAQGTGKSEFVDAMRDVDVPEPRTTVTAHFEPPEKGDELNGRWIVTVPIPNVTPEQNLVYYISSEIPQLQPLCR